MRDPATPVHGRKRFRDVRFLDNFVFFKLAALAALAMSAKEPIGDNDQSNDE
jgi:hypothetical protein